VENYLGPETFRKGVHAYLSAHEYGNATAEDFWNAQTATSHKPVDKIMESLVAQPGEPLLTFGEPANGSGFCLAEALLPQPPFSPTRRRSGPSRSASKPVQKSRTAKSSPPRFDVAEGAGRQLFFANAGGKGYYRSAYPPSVYAAIVANAETDLTPRSASA
jgi:hypothetical protein